MSNTEEKVINLQDRITVYATDKAQYHKAGEAVQMHPELAAKCINEGWFTAEKPKGKKD